MTSITVRKGDDWRQHGWTSIPNAVIRSETLTPDAKWAFSWLASHTENFKFKADDLAAAGPKGRNHARESLRELEEHGWLTRHKVHDPETKRIDGMEYHLHAIPVPVEDRTFKPSTAKHRAFPAKQNPSSEPAPDGPGAGEPGAGEPGPGQSVVPYKDEKTSREDQEVPTSPAPPPREDVELLCQRLRDRMIGNGCKPPTITDTWRTAARLLLDKDGRELDKALNLIDWATDDEFWAANIQSMPKFRAQYDTLRLRAIADHNAKRRAATPTVRPSTTDARLISQINDHQQWFNPDGSFRSNSPLPDRGARQLPSSASPHGALT